jgi:hypothetical protein
LIEHTQLTKLELISSGVTGAFRFPYFIHAGVFDAITTIIAITIGFSKLNPVVIALLPNYIALLPAFLVLLAYLRSLTVILLFKENRYFKPMMWLSLYFPGLFNMTGISMLYFQNL